MSFEADLLEAIGGSDDAWDLRFVVRRCYFYDFDGYPVRLWDGVGTMKTTTSAGSALTVNGVTIPADEWVGTINESGTNPHQTPSFQDARDGSSPEYEVKIPYLSSTVYDALKADQDLCVGRDMTIYDAFFKIGEGLRPTNQIRFYQRVEMRGAKFSDQQEISGGTVVRNRIMTIMCRSMEVGRSKVPNGIMNDVSQTVRASLLGLDSDSGCSMVASNSRRTYEIGG